MQQFISLCSCFALTTLALSTNSVLAGYNGSIEVKFTGLSNSKGKVCVNLFNGSKGFPEGGRGASLKAARCTTVSNRSSKITFTNLPYGTYAIAAVHDLNGDTQANKNFLGIPTEGVAFSNNPAIQGGAPSFSQTSFIISSPRTDLQVQMQYF